MLFLPDSATQARRHLHRRAEAGELTLEEMFRQALEIDPDDALSLYRLGQALSERGEDEEARRLLWRSIEADPTCALPYGALMQSYKRPGGDPEAAESLSWLATRRLLRDPESAKKTARRLLQELRKNLRKDLEPRDVTMVVDALSLERRGEPAPVTGLLEPYRLVQEVIDYPAEGMNPETVDRIVAKSNACAGLLTGVLRGWARGSFDNADAVIAAAALLGEIGDSAAMPALLEFAGYGEEEDIQDAACWAAMRLSARHPELRSGVPEFCEDVGGQLDIYDFCCEPLGDDEEEPPPVKPGRNDPCWCGSGKKYKKCHLAADENEAREAAEIDAGLYGTLLDYVEEKLPGRELRRAVSGFLGADGLKLDPDAEPAFTDWLLHDYVSPKLGGTIPQAYARQYGMSPVLEQWMQDRYSLYEVLRTEPGGGVELKDLLVGDIFFVNDDVFSAEAVNGEKVLTRVRQEDGGKIFGGVGLSLPPAVAEAVLRTAVERREKSGLEWPAWLRANGNSLRLACVSMMEAGGGEVHAQAFYDVLDEPALRAALRAAPELQPHEDGFVWAAGPESSAVLGNFRVEANTLAVECNSRQGLERAVALVHRIAGAAVRARPSLSPVAEHTPPITDH